MKSPAPRLSLHEWSCLRTELVWIYDHAPNPQARHGVFDHREGYWAWFLRKGEVRLTSRAGTLVACAGQWVFPPSEIHRRDFSDDAILISVRFRCQWPTGENIFNRHPGIVLDGALHRDLAKTSQALARLVDNQLPGSHYDHARQTSDYPQFLRVQRAFLLWLDAWFQANLAAGASPSRQIGDERIRHALRLLDETPLESGFPRAAVAQAGIGVIQLNRLFRKQFNLTPLQYWERRRLEFARLCLETSDRPLKEVAAHLGFRSDSHFTVWFKRHAGTSPGRHRARHSRA